MDLLDAAGGAIKRPREEGKGADAVYYSKAGIRRH